MIRTIFMIIGIVFATMALLFIMRDLQVRLGGENRLSITEMQTIRTNDSIRVSWSTDADTNGALYYYNSNISSRIADYEFDSVHSLTLSGIEGDVSYYIESCDPTGVCARSEVSTASLTIVRCADGTKSMECSSSKPTYCNNGILEDNCMSCGCPAGLRCITSGVCSNQSNVQNMSVS